MADIYTSQKKFDHPENKRKYVINPTPLSTILAISGLLD